MFGVKEIGSARELAEYLLHLEGEPIEQAAMIEDLLGKGWTQEQIGKAVGWSQPQISSRLKLLDLHPELQERARKGEIKKSVAWELASMPLEEQERFIGQEKILLKDVEEERRRLALTDEVMDVLNAPLLPEEPALLKCPKCGHEFEVELDRAIS